MSKYYLMPPPYYVEFARTFLNNNSFVIYRDQDSMMKIIKLLISHHNQISDNEHFIIATDDKNIQNKINKILINYYPYNKQKYSLKINYAKITELSNPQSNVSRIVLLQYSSDVLSLLKPSGTLITVFCPFSEDPVFLDGFKILFDCRTFLHNREDSVKYLLFQSEEYVPSHNYLELIQEMKDTVESLENEFHEIPLMCSQIISTASNLGIFSAYLVAKNVLTSYQNDSVKQSSPRDELETSFLSLLSCFTIHYQEIRDNFSVNSSQKLLNLTTNKVTVLVDHVNASLRQNPSWNAVVITWAVHDAFSLCCILEELASIDPRFVNFRAVIHRHSAPATSKRFNLFLISFDDYRKMPPMTGDVIFFDFDEDSLPKSTIGNCDNLILCSNSDFARLKLKMEIFTTIAAMSTVHVDSQNEAGNWDFEEQKLAGIEDSRKLEQSDDPRLCLRTAIYYLNNFYATYDLRECGIFYDTCVKQQGCTESRNLCYSVEICLNLGISSTIKGDVAETRKLAEMKAALKACERLIELGMIDVDTWSPINREFFRDHLPSIHSISLINTCRSEIPICLRNGDLETQSYFLYKINGLGGGRPMGILTGAKIPLDLPEIELYNKTEKLFITFTEKSENNVLTTDQLDLVRFFHSYILTQVVHIDDSLLEFGGSAESVNSLFVVLSTTGGEIDYEFMGDVRKRSTSGTPFTFTDDNLNQLVLSTNYGGKIRNYSVLGVSEKTGESLADDGESYAVRYLKRYGIELQHPEVNLVACVKFEDRKLCFSSPVENRDVHVSHVVTELCFIHPLQRSMWIQIMYLPSIFFRLFNLLKTRELYYSLKSQFEGARGTDFKFPPIIDFNVALTLAKCGEMVNLECYEFLGDSILNYLASMKLYRLFPALCGSALKILLPHYVNNSLLWNFGKKLNLPSYIQCVKFKVDGWLPPCYKLRENTTKMRLRYNLDREITDKSLADVVEAIIAVLFTEGSPEAGSWFVDLIKANNIFESPYSPPYEPVLSSETNHFVCFYRFKCDWLAECVFTHSCVCYSIPRSRLSFVGESVIKCLLSLHFFKTCENMTPEKLTRMRDSFISNGFYVKFCVLNDFQRYLKCYNLDHLEDGGLDSMNDTFLSFIGAVYFDCGGDLELVWQVVYENYDFKAM